MLCSTHRLWAEIPTCKSYSQFSSVFYSSEIPQARLFVWLLLTDTPRAIQQLFFASVLCLSRGRQRMKVFGCHWWPWICFIRELSWFVFWPRGEPNIRNMPVIASNSVKYSSNISLQCGLALGNGNGGTLAQNKEKKKCEPEIIKCQPSFLNLWSKGWTSNPQD